LKLVFSIENAPKLSIQLITKESLPVTPEENVSISACFLRIISPITENMPEVERNTVIVANGHSNLLVVWKIEFYNAINSKIQRKLECVSEKILKTVMN